MTWIEQKILGLFVKTKGRLSSPLLGGLGHIFMMHRVLPDSLRSFSVINRDLAITPDHLEYCLDYFSKKNYRFISLDYLYDILLNKKKIDFRFICLTLDDGYRDNLTFAYSILKKRDIPFTVYVTNCFPNRNGILWWYWLEKYMYKNNSINIVNGQKSKNICWKNSDEIKDKFQVVRSEILSLSHKELEQFCRTELKLDDEQIRKDCENDAMSWDEIRDLATDPLVTIGSHTMNHISLAAQSVDVLRFEMKQSKLELEQKLMKEVNHFAYPYGSFKESGYREYTEAASVGFKTATINFPGNIFHESVDALMYLPRMPLGNVTTKEKLDYISTGINHYSYNGFSKIPLNING
jgi:peptidoglycan/xylan/chitin deacetylase (PgdA/CDA1 family)